MLETPFVLHAYRSRCCHAPVMMYQEASILYECLQCSQLYEPGVASLRWDTYIYEITSPDKWAAVVEIMRP